MGGPCVFPFIYRGVTYNGCTTKDDDDKRFWCSTETDGSSIHVGRDRWGYCPEDCTVGDGSCGSGIFACKSNCGDNVNHRSLQICGNGRKYCCKKEEATATSSATATTTTTTPMATSGNITTPLVLETEREGIATVGRGFGVEQSTNPVCRHQGEH